MNNDESIKRLNELFGSYRAEWLKDNIFNLFTKPSYFQQLEDCRPCILQGGRGSGKTTALRGLSYQGQFALHGGKIQAFDEEVSYIGLYHRVDTNHVRSFIGGELPEERWQKIFGHYFNMIVCELVINFLLWHSKLVPNEPRLSEKQCQNIAASLAINCKCPDIESLHTAIEDKMFSFQMAINNIVDCDVKLRLSLTGDPIKMITHSVCELPQFRKKMFYILLDEYENFEDYQQVVVNTLLKHNTDCFTFKIGVRALGWRKKNTLNPSELLCDPADYSNLVIEERFTTGSEFETFVKEVCQQRLQSLLQSDNISEPFNIEDKLLSMSHEEEAELLGVENSEYVRDFHEAEKKNGITIDIPYLYKFLVAWWTFMHKKDLCDVVQRFCSERGKWDVRYDNYRYEMLFKIRTGRGSVGISKYYAGWNTFVKLASGNIRYLMALVYRAYERHLRNGKDILQPIDCKTQTIVAKEFGKDNLIQLESLCKDGAKLAKLLTSLGRVFTLFAKSDKSHAPEINQFVINNSAELSGNGSALITAAIMNLALIRDPGTKLNKTDTKDYIYSIHTIYAPFFGYSYRKKRKINLSEAQLWGLIDSPREYIRTISGEDGMTVDGDLAPLQLELFS